MPVSQFARTRWSVVLNARSADAEVATVALGELCQIYWYPLYAYARRRGLAHHAAEDLTQGLFCQLLSRDGLRRVDRSKGKFRSFLLVAMKHFMSNEWERASAQKRGGAVRLISIEMADGARRYEAEPVEQLTPEKLYERGWALAVLARAFASVAEIYQQRDRGAVFDALKGFITGEGEATTHAQLAAQLEMTEGSTRVLVHRFRRQFSQSLRAEVAQTVDSPEELTSEIQSLMACFGG